MRINFFKIKLSHLSGQLTNFSAIKLELTNFLISGEKLLDRLSFENLWIYGILPLESVLPMICLFFFFKHKSPKLRHNLAIDSRLIQY